MTQESPSPALVCHSLFNDSAADTVLRSAEGTLFRIPRFVLRDTTGYFAATLAAPPDPPDAEPVPLEETAAVLARALCLLSGLPPPDPQAATWDFATAEALLALAERWAAPGLASRVRDAAGGPPFVADPLRLYSLAMRAGWDAEARVAARGTLALALFDEGHATVLRGMPAHALLELLALHRRRRDELDALLGPGGVGVGPGLDEMVSGRCAACGLQGDTHLWREYRARIFMEMDIRPLGDTVIGFAVDEWPQALACWNAKCAGAECGKPLYERESILSQIKACIDKLPDTI
ncbi:hypothetical protein GGX14DRAFT_374675 [Mycena pura]|uniref:BTB domain-containing protein n=1 Tax=Mycena pura TaxID=153505 RepID=A0AAD6Y9J3_9AGAR|nr:hypothetical protein GGX14DRAFT_374675 [Mycena pura]